MEIILKRTVLAHNVTIGELYIDGIYECHILEDEDRGLNQQMPLTEINKRKVFGKTCIPYGRYEITITLSQRFTKLRGKETYLPLLNNVPGYAGIRIHTGNRPVDTEGCLLAGGKIDTHATVDMSDDTIAGGTSTVAFNQLFAKIKYVLDKKEKVFITIKK